MATVSKVITLVLLVFLLTSCLGYKTPTPESKEELFEMSPSTTWIRGRGLPDEAIPYLSRITGARSLDFEGGQATKKLRVTDIGLAKLAKINLPVAHMLRIGYCTHITDVGLSSISQMDNIEVLSLRACYGITDTGMKHLAKMKNLKILDIRGCPQITNDSLLYLSKSQSLERLYLGRLSIDKYSDETEIVNGLNLKSGNKISNEGFKYLANSITLKCLYLCGFDPSQIDNRCLQYLSDMPNLEEIRFYATPFLDTNSMTLLAKFKNLKNLTVSAEKCPSFTDGSLKALSESQTIEELTIYVNNKITFDGISCLKNIGTLKTIVIGYIKGVSKSRVEKQLHEFHQILPLCSVVIMNEKHAYIYEYYPSTQKL